ncbi:MAG: hypothetical protein GX410_04190, partial [Elusimicrobia bacterium]|nr:hypothetical protein [Elusimicrobiota bacterium]
MKKLFLLLAAILLPVLSHGRAAAAFIQADGTIASPYAFIPKLSQEKKDELLKRYVSGMVGKDYNLQWAPVTGWRDFNQYVCRTATLFDENDRKRIIAEVGLRLPGVYFKDAQISLHSGVYSVADMATGKEIDTAVSLPKPMMIDASDLWTVLYHYLEALKPANGEYSYPPVSYRYLKLNEKRLRLIISRVRPDLKPGSIEIEDAVSFVTRKGFLSGNVRLLRAEFEKNLALGRYLNSLRDGKAPNLGPGANMARFAKAAGPALKNLVLNQEGWSRLNVYLAYWGVVASVEGEPLFSVSREEGLSPVLAEQAEAASATASSFAAVVSSSIHPGGSEGAYREAQRPGMNAPHTAASVVSGLMSDAKGRVLSWFGKKPAKPAAQQPETETAQDKVLDDFILPEDVRVRQEPEEGEQVYQGTAAVAVAPSTSTESMAASDDSDFYGGLKSDLLSSRSRQPVAKIQDYELQIPLLADG